MGGAERAERRRKRQAMAAAPTAAAVDTGPDRRPVLIAVIVTAVLAVAVIGGVLWQRSQSGPGELPPKSIAGDYPVMLDGGVVVAGEESAEVTVDVYEDFLCPACGSFENANSETIEKALEEGTLKVRYHIVNILDEQSNPAGYSLDAGSAALCAAEVGEFPSYHASLFAKQPREGGRGYSTDQLVQLGRDLGITDPGFERCVRDGGHDGDVRAQEQSATTDPALIRTFPGGRKGFATPTVVIDGQIIDVSNANWLEDALRAAGAA